MLTNPHVPDDLCLGFSVIVKTDGSFVALLLMYLVIVGPGNDQRARVAVEST